MNNTSLVIQRNEAHLSEHSAVAIVAPPAFDDLSYLKPAHVYTFDYAVYKSHEAYLGEQVSFSLDSDDRTFDAAVVYMPKSKDELKLILHFMAPKLSNEASLYLVGGKKEGIASASKLLSVLGENVSKVDSAKHCQLWQVEVDKELPAFNLEEWVELYDAEIDGIALSIASIPGVFSFKRLDQGTELLLQNLPKKLQGRILDFGCGSGVIGLFAKHRFPEIDLEAVDINLFALLCTQRTFSQNGLEATLYPSDGWSDVKGRVQGVLTNPPFHSGVKTHYETTETFIKQGVDKMAKFAPLFLVANSFLRYGPIIESNFESYKLQAENTKFKVYYARR